MQSPPLRRRVLLLSTVHLATDPRIVGKIAPSLAADYEVYCALARGKKFTTVRRAVYRLSFAENGSKTCIVSIPSSVKLWRRLVLTHPLALWYFLRFRPHIVHIFVAELLPLAFVFRWLGAEVIYEVQENLYKKIPLKSYNRGWLFERFFRYFDQKARRTFKLIFTEDAYLNEYKNLSQPYAIIHNFASLHWLSTPLPVPNLINPTFFYAGVISLERAFDTVLSALVIVKKSYPNVRLRLFGHLRIDSKLLDDSAAYQFVKDSLIFYSYQPQEEAFKYTNDALAGIALLKPVGDYADSYPTKLFDYMALGLPVITSDLPLLRTVVEPANCGFCVSPYDAEALAIRMIWCIEHPEDLRKMGENGRKAIVEKYHWEEEKLLEIYCAKTA
jgi:glycosyltransferase involved in cell wall biosynthesis